MDAVTQHFSRCFVAERSKLTLKRYPWLSHQIPQMPESSQMNRKMSVYITERPLFRLKEGPSSVCSSKLQSQASEPPTPLQGLKYDSKEKTYANRNRDASSSRTLLSSSECCLNIGLTTCVFTNVTN